MKRENHSIKNLKKRVKLIRLLIKIAPGIGLRYVLAVFYRPIQFPTPEHEGIFKHGSIISREYVYNKRITVYHVGKSSKNILLVHGWSGRASQFYKLAPTLVQAGYKVFTFTAPAHGTSTDKQTDLLEFAECIAYLAHKYGPFEGIVGHSLGGMAALNAINYGILTKKVVLIATPGYITDVVKDFAHKLKLDKKAVKYIIEHMKKTYTDDFEKFSATRIAKQMTIPGLIVHDTEDKDVSIECARANHAAWKTSEIFETNGLGHRLILEDSGVHKRIVDFLAD